VCLDENFIPKCKCFKMFYGENCENETADRKVLKDTISATSIIAFAILVSFYLILFLFDLHTSYLNCRKKNRRKRLTHSFEVKKFTYHNNWQYLCILNFF
jgi:hypothetical protein